MSAGSAPAPASPDSLDAWDAELAEAGIELMDTRAAAVEVLAPLFARAAGELGLADRRASLRAAEQGRRAPTSSAPSWPSGASRISAAASPATARTSTSSRSPLGGRAARRYASQGQQRSALLALLFAERDALLAERADPPLMLLDDVTSELDPERRELLCDRLAAGGGQALVTATEASHLPATCAAARARGPRRRGDPRGRRREEAA